MQRTHDNPLTGVPLVESPFFKDFFSEQETDPFTFKAAVELNERGYTVIDFPDDEIGAVADRIIADLEPRYDWEAWRAGQITGMRLQEAWEWNEDVRRLAVNDRVLRLLSDLYGRPAVPFQTLNFPVGSQQHYHTDSVHFSSIPERFMVGVWIALEDVHPDAGPLVYYPGSHKWPIYVNEHIGHIHDPAEGTYQTVFEPLWERLVEVHGIKPERLVVNKGQAVIWAANLLHGGDEHRNRLMTRWSQVNHYYFEGCSYHTPMHSDPAYGSIAFREPLNILTGKRHANMYCGKPVDPSFIASVNPRHRLPPLTEGFSAADYLDANPDVAAAGVEAEQHYQMFGRREKRPLRPEPA